MATVIASGLAIAQAGKPVQPKAGPPPDQAESPDLGAQVPAGKQEQFPEPVVEPEPEKPAAPLADKPETEKPAEEKPAQEEPLAQEKPEEPAMIPAATPEGRRVQQQAATLLLLARDLKTELDKAGANTLSVAALRKAEEIQKMSRTLKQEMGQR